MRRLLSYLDRHIDRKLIWSITMFYSLFLLVAFVRAVYFRVFTDFQSDRTLLDLVFGTYLKDLIIVVFFMTVIAVNTKISLERNKSWTRIIAFHLIFSIIMGILTSSTGNLFMVLGSGGGLQEFNLKSTINRFMSSVHMFFLVYAALVGIIYSYYYQKEVIAGKSKKLQLETQLHEARLKILNAQMSPHFLFNTLNCISTLTSINPNEAKDTISDLSEFLRRVLYTQPSSLISLEEEILTLEFYLNILKTRFKENLQIELDLEHNLLSEKVPALLIQPIIENSMKHGYSYNNVVLVIRISVREKQGNIELRVWNNGEELPSGFNGEYGVGLSNIKERLINLYGHDHSFNMMNKDKGVETVICFPKSYG